MADGAGVVTEDGDGVVVGAGVALLGLDFRDGRGELVVGAGVVGLAVGAELVGVTVAGVLGVVVAGELAKVGPGLTQV